MTVYTPKVIRVAFLDRDGTLTVDVPKGYTHRIEDFAFENRVIEGLQLLQQQNYHLVVITNQSGIGRGYFSTEQYQRFMAHMEEQLRKHGITLSGIYYCPHHPTKALGEYKQACNCRKPKTGLIDHAIADLALKGYRVDLPDSFVIGDKTADGMLGNMVGCRSVLVRYESGEKGLDSTYSCSWAHHAEDLLDAANWIKENTLAPI